MEIEKIIERLSLMEKHFIEESPAPEYAETCHYAIEALKALKKILKACYNAIEALKTSKNTMTFGDFF